MSRYIDLNGNTWDGTKITSKIRHDDRYGAFITIGWLFSDSVPVLDLEEHDKEIRDKAIEEFAEKLKERCNSMISAEWNSEVAPISWADAYADFKDDIDEIAEQMKEVGDTKKILSEKAKGQNRKNRKFASNNPELPEVER